MGWRTDKKLELTSRGLITIIHCTSIADYGDSYRVSRWEKQVGDMKVKTFEQVYSTLESAYEIFNDLAVEALHVEFTHPDTKGAHVIARFDDTVAEETVDA